MVSTPTGTGREALRAASVQWLGREDALNGKPRYKPTQLSPGKRLARGECDAAVLAP